VNKYRVNEEQLLYRFTPHIEVHYMPLWFLGQKIKREIYVTRIRERIYPTRMGWGLGKLKRKIKKKYRIAVNHGELCAFSARAFYTTEVSNERRIANRKYRNIYIIVFNRVIPTTEERELYPFISRYVGNTKILRYTLIDVSNVAWNVNADPVLS